MANGEAKHPFHFMLCWELREMLGVGVRDAAELYRAVEEVPLDSIHFHTHGYLLRHRYLAGPYPNDYATWAAVELRDTALAERLGVVDPFEIGDLEGVRRRITQVLEHHLDATARRPRAVGEPFHFCRSRILPVAAGIKTRTLAEFAHALHAIDTSAIYYHVVETPSKRSRRRSDFAIWIEESLGLADVAARVAAVHPHGRSLESVRTQILRICERSLRRVAS